MSAAALREPVVPSPERPESEHSVPAPDVSEQKAPPEEHAVWEELTEIIEVIVLALVAIATAWSGYQAAEWNGQQSPESPVH